jgi:tryptophanyl-tRNA synthetase
LKGEVIERTLAALTPIQQQYQAIRQDMGYLETVLADGAQCARTKAAPTLAKAYEAVGFIPPR